MNSSVSIRVCIVWMTSDIFRHLEQFRRLHQNLYHDLMIDTFSLCPLKAFVNSNKNRFVCFLELQSMVVGKEDAVGVREEGEGGHDSGIGGDFGKAALDAVDSNGSAPGVDGDDGKLFEAFGFVESLAEIL